MAEPDYTPTQRRILAILGDGQSHTREELMGCLNDELAEEQTLKNHINRLRQTKLRPIGQNIICEIHGAGLIYYRLTRLINVTD